MSCLPTGGGCERSLTDDLAAQLNEAEGTQFRYVRCLDVHDRSRPLPEALYEDPTSGRRLVIEHKCVVWPPRYAERHHNDHLIADALFERLREFVADWCLVAELQEQFSGKREDREAYVEAIIAAFRQGINEIRHGRILRGCTARHTWALRLPHAFDGEGVPESGIGFAWPSSMASDPKEHEGIKSLLGRFFQSCNKKFATFADARRVLVLSLAGKASTYALGRALHEVGQPSWVDDVWVVFDETDEEHGPFRIFDPLKPLPPPEPFEWPKSLSYLDDPEAAGP